MLRTQGATMKNHQVARREVKKNPQTQQKELDSNLENYRDLDDLDDTFDQDSKVLDENLYHGLDIKKGEGSGPQIEDS